MRVAFYFTSEIIPERGGTERVTYVISKQLETADIECIYLSLKKTTRDELCASNQYYLPNSECLICEENVKYANQLFKEKEIDILINQDSFESGYSFCTRKYFSNITCLTVIHYNLWGGVNHINDLIKESYLLGNTSSLKYSIQCLLMPYYRHRARSLRKRALREIYEGADYVVLLSEADKKDYPVEDKKRLFVISNPVTLSSHTERVAKEKRVLFVGRMVYNPKRVDLLLKAWKIVENRYPDWKLDLLGDGSCLDYFKKLSIQLQLKNAKFFGNCNPQDYYRRASIFCMTSSYEGFGLVLTEAMQFGAVPIAFSSFDAIHDIIDNGKDGMLVRPFSVEEYANAIIRLIEDEKLRSSMSQAAILKVNKFSISRIGEYWINLLYHIRSSNKY